MGDFVPEAVRFWPWFVAAAFAAFFLTGGVTVPSDGMLRAQAGLATVLLGWSLIRLLNGLPNRSVHHALLIGATALALILTQIVPLPPPLWQALPGRGYVIPVFDAAGVDGSWQSLSLDPGQTLRSGLMMLPALAVFLAALSVNEDGAGLLAATVVILGFCGVAIGFVQFVGGKGIFLDLYGTAIQGRGGGTFGNRNLFATQLFTALPVLAALLLHLSQQWHWRGWLTAGFGTVLSCILLAGIAVTGSRAGVLLAMASIALTVIMLATLRPATPGGIRKPGYAFAGGFAALLVIGQSSMAGLLRLTQRDPLEDFRSVINAVSLEAASSFFPTGSGIGTFAPVYQLAEMPAHMIESYVNHAHNDLLQFYLEGGLPALVIMVMTALWLVATMVSVWRSGAINGNALYARAFSLSLVLLLAHSLVDFPLRTTAHFSFFGLACAMMCLPLRAQRGFCRRPLHASSGKVDD
jgi:O-antigen ligase